MGKRLFLSVAVGELLLLGIAAASLGGLEPSSSGPEINKLHSLTHLNATVNQFRRLQTKLKGVLFGLPFDIAEHIAIVIRVEIEPSIWLPFRNSSIRIISMLNAHILPILPQFLPPQLPASLKDLKGRPRSDEICAWRRP
jgi:hypothetical protein